MFKILLCLLLCFASWAHAADLSWNASVVDAEHAAPDGYRINWGSTPGVYTGQADAGTALTWHIPDDWYGSYYFAASAYNSAGQSGYSNEVIFTRDQQQYIGATGITASRYQVEKMAIERIGTYLGHLMTSGQTTYAWSVTIPSDCTCIVIIGGGYSVYSGEPLISADLNGTQSFFVDQSLDAANDSNVFAGHLFSPSATGAQTINFTLGAHGYDTYVYLLFYKGVATTGLRDSDEAQGTSLTLTTQSGDFVVTVGTDQDNNSITWTNATEIYDYADSAGFSVAIAETVADGTTETVSISGSNCAIAAIVLQPAAGGGASAVPVIMRSYRARRN